MRNIFLVKSSLYKTGPLRAEKDRYDRPNTSPLFNCFKEQSQPNCNLLFQEDCTYEGNSFIDTPNGTVVDPKTCEELCFEYHDLTCEYWLYDSKSASCILLDSKERSCETWGGPKYPSFSFCSENLVKKYLLQNNYIFYTVVWIFINTGAIRIVSWKRLLMIL